MSMRTSFMGSIVLALAMTVASSAYACPGEEHKDPKGDTKKEAPKKVLPAKNPASAVFRVDGMHCGSCADKVKAALGKTEGVTAVEIKLADQKVLVNFDADKISVEKIAKLISDLGYPATAEV